MFETFGFFLSKIKVIPSASPTVISFFADKKFIKLSYIEKISLKYMF